MTDPTTEAELPDVNAVPEVVTFKNGTTVEYDHDSGELIATDPNGSQRAVVADPGDIGLVHALATLLDW